MMLSIIGFASAALSPLAMTIGFIIWGKSWQGTPFSLNLFKCALAGSLFMIVSMTVRNSKVSSLEEKGMVIVSSIIGIIIGDNTWLLALKIIGAKRVIVIDALKPFCAAFAGYILLDESLTSTICVGLVVSSVGVVMVATERDDTNATKDGDDCDTRPNYCWGYILAAVNVLLDAFGSVLTKQFGSNMNTWEINFLRFGFAAIFMALLSVIMYVVDGILVNCKIDQAKLHIVEMTESRHALNVTLEDDSDDVVHSELPSDQLQSSFDELRISNTQRSNEQSVRLIQSKWYEFPVYTDMSLTQWGSVTLGVIFVTFLCPAMANYALFQLPLSLCLTLTSLGPVYSLPLVYLLLGEKSGTQSVIGSLLAVAGIVIMCV